MCHDLNVAVAIVPCSVAVAIAPRSVAVGFVPQFVAVEFVPLCATLVPHLCHRFCAAMHMEQVNDPSNSVKNSSFCDTTDV